MKVLVIGGTGLVGSLVVKELLSRKADVFVLTRDAGNKNRIPTGATAVEGNLQDPETVKSIFNGIEAVFMLNPVSLTETSEGLFAVNGARLAGVKSMVYMSVQDCDRAVHLPHFGSKFPIEEAIRISGMDFTLLRPNNFYQNDLWMKDGLLQHGLYSQPIGSTGLSRVDVRDIAEAAAIAITSNDHKGEVYNIVGPDVHTGQSTAEAWSRALGKSISYAGDDLEAWEKQSLQYMPAYMVFDFKLMYDYFQKEGLKATTTDIERQTKLLGHAPRSFEAFATETASMWTNPA